MDTETVFTTDMTTKLASEVQVGDVLVFRPDPEALTIDYLPTVYRKVEKIEIYQGKRSFPCFLFRPPHNAGHWRMAEFDDKFEVTDEVDESCSILPSGLVLR